MQVFDLIYVVMTKNNPAMFKIQSLVYLFYRYAFVENNKGYGATIIVLLLLIIMAITAVRQYIQNRWVHYE
jgi:multiple sugar transport system permease protein